MNVVADPPPELGALTTGAPVENLRELVETAEEELVELGAERRRLAQKTEDGLLRVDDEEAALDVKGAALAADLSSLDSEHERDTTTLDAHEDLLKRELSRLQQALADAPDDDPLLERSRTLQDDLTELARRRAALKRSWCERQLGLRERLQELEVKRAGVRRKRANVQREWDRRERTLAARESELQIQVESAGRRLRAQPAPPDPGGTQPAGPASSGGSGQLDRLALRVEQGALRVEQLASRLESVVHDTAGDGAPAKVSGPYMSSGDDQARRAKVWLCVTVGLGAMAVAAILVAVWILPLSGDAKSAEIFGRAAVGMSLVGLFGYAIKFSGGRYRVHEHRARVDRGKVTLAHTFFAMIDWAKTPEEGAMLTRMFAESVLRLEETGPMDNAQDDVTHHEHALGPRRSDR